MGSISCPMQISCPLCKISWLRGVSVSRGDLIGGNKTVLRRSDDGDCGGDDDDDDDEDDEEDVNDDDDEFRSILLNPEYFATEDLA